MKKLKSILCISMMALSMLFAACNSCSKPTPEPEPVFAGYNFDNTVIGDYDYIASQEEMFMFRTAEVRFDSTLTKECENQINYVVTWFQCGHYVNMIFHTPDTNRMKEIMEFIDMISTDKSYKIDTNETDFRVHLRFNDAILECGEINARNPITFDSCMKIVEPYKDQLRTRVITLRKFIDPRLPENPLYIFGNGILTVDAVTGEVGTLKESNDTVMLSPSILESGIVLDIQ